MMDQLNSMDPEKRVICPYNKAHEPTRKRLATHLEKCRKSHPDLARQLKRCQFNYAHRIPECETQLHEETCPDRDTLVNHLYQVGNDEDSAVNALMENTKVDLYKSSGENWMEQTNTQSTSVLATIHTNSYNRGVLRNHTNEPPSVRKARREEDRQRMKERINAEEQAGIDQRLVISSAPSVSRTTERNVSSASQVVSSSAASDASYNTALETATNRLQEFQVVRRKGRGKGLEPKTSTVGGGVGRGFGRGHINREKN